MSALQVKSRLKNLLLIIPNLLLLCARLLTDSRVPAAERAMVAAAIVYAIVPFRSHSGHDSFCRADR